MAALVCWPAAVLALTATLAPSGTGIFAIGMALLGAGAVLGAVPLLLAGLYRSRLRGSPDDAAASA